MEKSDAALAALLNLLTVLILCAAPVALLAFWKVAWPW